MKKNNVPVGIDGLEFKRIGGGFKICGTVEGGGVSLPVCQKVTDAQLVAFLSKAREDVLDEVERFTRRGGLRGVFVRLTGEDKKKGGAK